MDPSRIQIDSSAPSHEPILATDSFFGDQIHFAVAAVAYRVDNCRNSTSAEQKRCWEVKAPSAPKLRAPAAPKLKAPAAPKLRAPTAPLG